VTLEAPAGEQECLPDARESRESEARPERVCPNCGAALIEHKCKLLCPEPACGYYMSCSEFY
jgi:ribosomal protein S27AE